MTKTQKQIVDDFFFEYGGTGPAAEPNKFDRFKNLNLDELYSLAKHIIGLRIALHFSGQTQENQTALLLNEEQNLFQLSEQQLKESIDHHSTAYKVEKDQ